MFGWFACLPRTRESDVLKRGLVVYGLVAAGLAAWHNSFSGAFVLDDQSDILGNPAIQKLWPPDLLFGWPPPIQRPVTMLTFAANHALGGLDVWGWHAVSLLIHVLAGLALFGLVRRTLRRHAGADPAAPEGAAGAVALLWMVHPLQTESVTYLVQRAESLAGLCHFFVLYAALRAHESRRGGWWAAAAAGACLAGVLAKESMAVAPLAVALYDRGFLFPSFRRAFRERWKFYMALAASWLVLAALLIAGPHNYAGFGNAKFAVLEYVRTQPGVILHYLRLCFWPNPLMLDYGWPVARTAGEIVPGVLVVGGLLALLLRSFRSHPRIGATGLWGFLALAPSSSVLPLRDMEFEHRMYLPLAAVVALAVLGASRAIGRLRWPAGRLQLLKSGLVLGVAAVLGVLTIARNADYHTAVGMYRDMVAKRPMSVRGHHNLATALSEEGKLDEALAEIRKTVEIMPDYAEGYFNLGVILSRLGRTREAIAAYRKSLALKPAYGYSAVNLVILLRKEGREKEAASVILKYREAVGEGR